MSLKQVLALILALAMLLSMAGCVKAPQNAQVADQDQSNAEQELDRQDKELIAELIGGENDPQDLTDEQLDDLIDQLIGEAGEDALSGVVNVTNQEDKEPSGMDDPMDSDSYDENGAMTKPFDQVYPDMIEKEQVTFSGESILIKMRSNKLTDGLKAAGVGALEQIVPLEGCAWYEAKLVEGTDAKTAVAAVRQLGEVMLAEFNYEVQTAALDDYKHFDEEQGEDFKKNGHNKDQWHFHYCGIPDGYQEMETEGGDKSVIVAVIDSGVDYEHEDLKDNMWVNTKEIPDNGKDDDGNGYVDDYYGVDIIDKKGNGDDTNGHGTHVAGIIAARNNNVGTLGIAYNVKIMSVKAAAHNGTLNQADIAKAVLYAYENGAEVINMSFGGSASSIAVQDALQTAYTRCVLVASAGNNGENNEPTADDPIYLPNYPAALTYVLGVMSVDENGVESVFTNYDVKAFNNVEYELYAPGENIMSTLPGNQYGYLSGTSMAAPVVSAFAAILRSEYSDRDMYPSEFIYGQLTSTSQICPDCLNINAHGAHNLPQVVDLNAALTKLPKPEVNVQDWAIFDDPKYSANNNGDGVIDAGETIALGLTVRNRWGMSKNTQVTIDTLSSNSGLSDPYLTIKTGTVDFGSVGTYSTQDNGKIYTDELLTGWESPFLIEVSKDCPNEYRFTLNVTITCENALDAEDTVVYTTNASVSDAVRSGRVLPSIIEEDMVLTKDSLYIIPNATIIQDGVTVRVEPGTHIQFWSNDPKDPYASNYIAYLLVNGNFIVEGTKEEPVYIYPSQLMDRYGVEIGAGSNGYVSFKYADITNFAIANSSNGNHTGTNNRVNLADHCTFRQNYSSSYMYYRYLSNGKVVSSYDGHKLGNVYAVDSVFYKIASQGNVSHFSTAKRCIFVECGIAYSGDYQDCVFLKNNYVMDNGQYRNSSFSSYATPSIPTVDKIRVYYSQQTGTTYIVSNEYAINTKLLTQMGGAYFVPETQEEYQWVVKQVLEAIVSTNSYNRNNYNFRVGIQYNYELGQYTWSDGTPIMEWADPAGVRNDSKRYNTVYLDYNGQPKVYTSTSSGYGYYVYEIPGEVYPWTVDFAETEVTLDMRTPYQLAPVSTPIQPSVEEYIYRSTDTSVVSVDERGFVTPTGIGTANVIVYTSDKGVYNHVTFHVLSRGIQLEETEVTLYNRDTYQIAPPVATPIHKENEAFVYTSGDENIVKVTQDGLVYAVGIGEVTVTVSSADSVASNSISFNVKPRGVTVAEEIVTLCHIDTYQIVPGMEPMQYEDDHFTYDSSDESVAKVDANGLITAVTPGTAMITIYGGKYTVQKQIAVEVQEFYFLQNLNFTQTQIEQATGTTYQTVLTLDPDNANTRDLAYASDNEDVAIVDEKGLVTVLGSGVANITATCQGKTATLQVTGYKMATSVSINKNSCSFYNGSKIYIGREYQYMDLPEVTVSDGGEPNLVWSTTSATVAVVVDGKLQLLTDGTTSLKVTDLRSGKYDTVTVQIYSTAPVIAGNYEVNYIRENGPGELPAVTMAPGAQAQIQWSTNDESIAKVIDGKLHMYANTYVDGRYTGNSVYVYATDPRTGLKDSIRVYIKATSPILHDEDWAEFYFGQNYWLSNTNGSISLPAVTLAPGMDVEPQWTIGSGLKLVDGKLQLTGDMYSTEIKVTDPRNGLSDYIHTKTNFRQMEFDEPVIVLDLTAGQAPLPEVYTYGVGKDNLVWSVADTSIAELSDGKLLLKKAGITDVTVTNNQGESATCRIIVTSGQMCKVKKILTQNGTGEFYGVIMENGDLYKSDWFYSSPKSAPYDTGVKDYCEFTDEYGYTSTVTLYEDGRIVVSPGNGGYYSDYTETIEGAERVFLSVQEYADDPSVTGEQARVSCFVLTQDGYLYFYGTGNKYGQGATGSLTAQTYFTNVCWEGGVKDVIVGKTISYMLNDAGELYVSGGKEQKQSAFGLINLDDKVAKLLYIHQETEKVLVELESGILVYVDGPYYIEEYAYYNGWGTEYITETSWDVSRFSDYCVADGSPDSLSIQGIVGGMFYDGYKFIDGIRNLVMATASYGVTENGNLYSVNWYNGVTPDKFELISIPDDLSATATVKNVSQDGILTDSFISVEFPVKQKYTYGNIYQGDQYVDSVSVYDNTIWTDDERTYHMALPKKCVAGNTYTLKYSVGRITGAAGTWNNKDIVFTFTYQPAEAETAAANLCLRDKRNGSAVQQEAIPELSENHTTLINGDVMRYYNISAIVKELNALQNQLQYQPCFYGNAILNHISTDTNVEHWLRPIATTVTAGTYKEIPLGGNYWGTTNETAIGLQMVDYSDYITYARLMYAPYLTEAPENTFPFVTAVKLINKNGEEVTTVGNEQITFRITFNRDMDTSIPLQVRFGSAMPYGDYQIDGQYVDARTWEGVYTLKTVIENGYQYFTISNGCSATDDLELQIDQGRFGFEIDTTAAQALIMQGTATDTGIELRWTQDDFKTLMGYNVYRSTKEDGQYTRLNKTVIPADTLSWFDNTVEPGVVYYYNFTVVQTDLTESEPSGKIALMSKDTMAPDIYHSPVVNAFTGSNLVLSATITDNLNIAYANLYYRAVGTESWSIIRMNKLNDKYSAIIPASYITVAGVEYYIEAFDGVSYTYKGSAETPYTIAVQEALDVDALGDVDGDGVITNLDALLLLYAINDKYNLKPEEFARADLNGDGELWAAEALRILQYVSGAVGSVKM